jgi:hypothetical protein
MGVGGQRHAPAALPPGMTRYPFYRSLGRRQGRSVRVLKISPTPGFDPRTLQPVVSRYTDWAIPAHTCFCTAFKRSPSTVISCLYNVDSSSLSVVLAVCDMNSDVPEDSQPTCRCQCPEGKWVAGALQGLLAHYFANSEFMRPPAGIKPKDKPRNKVESEHTWTQTVGDRFLRKASCSWTVQWSGSVGFVMKLFCVFLLSLARI